MKRQNNNPRCVRNFFLRGDVDGLRSGINTGPKGRDGGFELEISIRENGSVSNLRLRVVGEVTQDSDGNSVNKVSVGVFDGITQQRSLELTVPRDEPRKAAKGGKPAPAKKEPLQRRGAFWEIK